MELTTKNGSVDFILLNGNTKVAGKMSEHEAKQLLKSGKVKVDGSIAVVDGKFVFGVNGADAKEEIQKKEEPKPKKEVKKEEVKKEEAPKVEDKPLKEVKGKSLTKRKPRKKAKKQ